MYAATKNLTRDEAGYNTWKQRALAQNPKDGDFFVTVAELNSRVRQYDKAAEYAAALGRPELIPDLMEMAAVEVEHEKFFLGVLGRSAPGQRRCD